MEKKFPSIKSDFAKLMDHKLDLWAKKVATSSINNMPSGPYDYIPNMPSKETSKHDGANPLLSFLGWYKTPPHDRNTWHHFPKLDMHKFDGSNPTDYVSLMG